jgi:hypothetical protein
VTHAYCILGWSLKNDRKEHENVKSDTDIGNPVCRNPGGRVDEALRWKYIGTEIAVQ